jgi:MFS family permease
MLPGLVLTGLGIGLATTSTTTTAMASVPVARAGIAGATLNASRTLGLSFGIAVMGAVVAARWPGDLAATGPDPRVFAAGIAAGFIVNAALALVAAIIAATTIRSPTNSQSPTLAAVAAPVTNSPTAPATPRTGTV